MINSIVHGDCIPLMTAMAESSVDFILTDPPYLVNYRSRDGRRIANDRGGDWVQAAFTQMHRVLKDNAFAVTFYGWNHVGLYMDAWTKAGFSAAGHIPFPRSMPAHRVTCGIPMNRHIFSSRDGRHCLPIPSPM